MASPSSARAAATSSAAPSATEQKEGPAIEKKFRANFVFHGHFYQPPRENPWTDTVEREWSARPFHDWNERINHECYASNAVSALYDDASRITRFVSNYEMISFNFGPTLLHWMEDHDAQTLQRIVEADRNSQEQHDGHGNAIAQTYNHIILPLADIRDRRTQIRWGLIEFQHRFGRKAEAIWLAETAANHAVLDELIEHRMRYVLLAPRQAAQVRESAEDEWQDVRGGRIDPSQPYRYLHRDGSGRSIAVFFYDGPLAASISFGDALREGPRLADRVEAATNPESGPAQLVSAAVDGETAGHHVAWGNLALAWGLAREIPDRGYRRVNYGQYLDEHPPRWEVELDLGPLEEGSSWSCAHGVGRWIRDCGCKVDTDREWSQEWRTPLREALDLLRDRLRPFFETEAGELLQDPWVARDDYIRLLLQRDPRSRQRFFQIHGRRELDEKEIQRALSLLEMQHHLMLMYTSCGWFFDDIGGLESVQILRYAARALDLCDELDGPSPWSDFEATLDQARSNEPSRGSAADIFRREVLAGRSKAERAVAHLAMSSVLRPPTEEGHLALHRFERRFFHLQEREGTSFATGRFVLEHERTLRPSDLQVAMLHTGGLEFITAVAPYSAASFDSMQRELHESFDRGDHHRLRERLDHWFDGRRYGAEDLLEPGRQELLASIFHEVIDRFGEAYAGLYASNRDLLQSLFEMGMELPEELKAAATFTLRRRFERAFLEQSDGDGPKAQEAALAVVEEALAHDIRLECPSACRRLEEMLEQRISDLSASIVSARRPGMSSPVREQLDGFLDLLELARRMKLDLDLRNTQAHFYDVFIRDAGQRESWSPALVETLERAARRLGFAPHLLISKEDGHGE